MGFHLWLLKIKDGTRTSRWRRLSHKAKEIKIRKTVYLGFSTMHNCYWPCSPMMSSTALRRRNPNFGRSGKRTTKKRHKGLLKNPSTALQPKIGCLPSRTNLFWPYAERNG